MTWCAAALLALLGLLAASAGAQDTAVPTVRVPQGELRPTLMQSAFDSRTIYAFLGVPYGRVTERFGRAEPAGPWQGVLNATADGAECVQWDERQQRAIGSEQCLYLNVYTSSLPPTNPTAPLVFLHGGDWMSGSGGSRWYGPRYWLDHDVVLVTVNSRLGAFGFLSTGDRQAPGNLGLHDQVLALDWINSNIQFFGGVHSMTTIMGEGTGAVSVHMLQLTQRAKNLFERAISQSGTAFCPGALVPETVANGRELASRLACSAADSAAMLACLRDASAEDIARATAHLSGQTGGAAPFGPVVDAYATEPFLPKLPSELMAENNFRHSPWIVGTNRDEGADAAYALLSDNQRLERLNGRFTELAPQLLHFAQTAADPVATSEQIRKHYFGDRPIDDRTAPELVELLTDRMFLHCTEKAAWWHSHYSTLKVFVYQWNLIGRLHIRDLEPAHPSGADTQHWHPGHPRFARHAGAHNLGVSQKDELLLMFSNELAPLYDASDPLVSEIREILNMWVTFAKTGDPTPDVNGVDSGLWREYWEYFYPFDQHYLIIDRTWTAVTELRPQVIAFWDSLGLRENVFKHKLVVRDEL